MSLKRLPAMLGLIFLGGLWVETLGFIVAASSVGYPLNGQRNSINVTYGSYYIWRGLCLPAFEVLTFFAFLTILNVVVFRKHLGPFLFAPRPFDPRLCLKCGYDLCATLNVAPNVGRTRWMHSKRYRQRVISIGQSRKTALTRCGEMGTRLVAVTWCVPVHRPSLGHFFYAKVRL